MVFLQHCFHSEQHCFPVLRIFQTDWVLSNTQSSLVIQNSCSIDYPCILSLRLSTWDNYLSKFLLHHINILYQSTFRASLYLYPLYAYALPSHILTLTLESSPFWYYVFSYPSIRPYLFFLVFNISSPLIFFCPITRSSKKPDLRLYWVEPAGLPLESPSISWKGKSTTSLSTLILTFCHSYESIGLPYSPTGETSPYSKDAVSHILTPTWHQVQSPMVQFFLPQEINPTVL